MMRCLRFPPLPIGAAPLVGLWVIWIVPTPIPPVPGGQLAAARAATTRVKERQPRRSEAGRALFQARCARCHDADGKGANLHESNPHAPDFTNPRWHQSHSASALVVSILDGKGTQMPAFGGRLTDAQVRDVVAYLRSLAPALPTAIEVSPDDFEARFSELEAEFERLRQQLQDLSPPRKR
jgi:mono/diheme cytochrome c family protein